jgi:hypothetical protein
MPIAAPVCLESFERRILFHHGHHHLDGLTVEQINALPDTSPIPFDLHVDDDAPVPVMTSPAPPAPWTTILNSGPSSNRVDIVIVGDGYTAGELPTTYTSHAQTFVNSFFNDAPLNAYKSFFNVHRVDVTSNQSGVDHDPTQGVLRDTALDMEFWCAGIERLLCVDVAKAYSYASNAPQVDQVIAVANSSKYGGAGYPGQNLGTYSGANGSSIEVARHEFGHAFADLADEYDYGDGATYTGPEPVETNISIYNAAQLAAQQRKWHRWLDLPNVDAFEGAHYNQFGIYRPTANSKMRSLNRPFEQVNTEQLIINAYKTVRPIDNATAPGSYPTDTNFFVDPVDPVGHALSVQWYIDGAPVAGATGPTFNPASQNLSGTHTLSVRVADDTPLVRDDVARATWLSQVKSWTLLDVTAPAVSGSTFAFDAPPQALKFTFTEDVSASLSVSDLRIERIPLGTPIEPDDIALSYDHDTNVATFTFPGFEYGALPNGDYRATLLASGVTDSSGNALASNHVLDFFFLMADADHNHVIDADDYALIDSGFNLGLSGFSNGDFNYDGVIDGDDYAIIDLAFNAQ